MSNTDNNTTVANAESKDKTKPNDTFNDVSSVTHNPWDPLHCADWDIQPPSITCLSRIKRDITHAFKDPPPGIFISPDANNVTKVHALIIGPFDTPYEGGFFYFLLRFPPDYPIRPPRCRLMTTGNHTVRFNPNLYRNGKICLSILGTWTGPSWSPAQCLSSVLISIQSLMSEQPYHNEPGFETERRQGDAKAYNEIIQHETLRVAVCEMLEYHKSCPESLYQEIVKQFPLFYDRYVEICTENKSKDGQQMKDPFGEPRGTFQYESILERLKKLKDKFESKSPLERQQDPKQTQPQFDETPNSSWSQHQLDDTSFDDIFDEFSDDSEDNDDHDCDNDDSHQT